MAFLPSSYRGRPTADADSGSMSEKTGRGGRSLMDGKPMASRTSQSFDPTDHAILAILQADGRLGVTEIARRVNSRRLEMVVDSIARFGPVTTSLVLRTYQAKAITGELRPGPADVS
jgi:hypothetical protein